MALTDICYLLTPVDDEEPPDVTSIRRHFSYYGTVEKVKVIPEGIYVYVTGTDWKWNTYKIDPLTPVYKKMLTVDGHRVQVDLLLPDVHGCPVTVSCRQVEIQVGSDVIDRIGRDELWQEELCQNVVRERDIVSFWLGSKGHVVATLVSSLTDYSNWLWECLLLHEMIHVLRVFKQLLPKRPRCIQDRRLCRDKALPAHQRSSSSGASASSGASSSSGSSSSSGPHENAFIVFGKERHDMFTFLTHPSLVQRVCGSLPATQLNIDTSRRAVKLSGSAEAVENTWRELCHSLVNVHSEDVPVTEMVTMMLKKADTRLWLQEVLDRQDVPHYWGWSTSVKRKRKQAPGTSYITVVALLEDHYTISRIIQSSIAETTITVEEEHIPMLLSDSWKLFVKDMEMTNEWAPAPVLKVSENIITIVDVSKNMDNTRHVIRTFLYDDLIDGHQDFSRLREEKIITNIRPWQLKLLSIPRIREQASSVVGQAVFVDPESETASFSAPIHLLDRCNVFFWRYVSSFFMQTIILTPARRKLMLRLGTRIRIQSRLDEEGVDGIWYVEDELLVFCGEGMNHEKLEEIFESELDEM